MSIRKFANEEERENAIRVRANEIWQQEGHPNGRDKEHWVMAETEIDDTGFIFDVRIHQPMEEKTSKIDNGKKAERKTRRTTQKVKR